MLILRVIAARRAASISRTTVTVIHDTPPKIPGRTRIASVSPRAPSFVQWLIERSARENDTSTPPGKAAYLNAGLLGLRWVGLGVVTAGVALYVVGFVGMGESWRIGIDTERPGPLVTRGLFAHVRHPLYSGILAAAAGMALLTADGLALAAVAAIWTAVPIQARLEAFLASRYPEYGDYQARTGRFVPRRAG
jgi:protein-S-isoprenylcysteine O-methyltransferase Ste14